MFIKLGKIITALFLLYITWFYGTFGSNPMLLYALALGATMCVFADMITSKGKLTDGMYSLIPMLIVFGVYSFFSGIFVAQDINYMLSSLVTYLAYVIICYDACYISRRCGSIEWIVWAILVAAMFCAIQTIFWGKDFISSGYVVKTLGPDNNPNSLGLIMLFGIFAAVNRKSYDKYFIVSLILSIVFLYVIVLTGSRKCLIGGVALFLIWLFVYVVQEFKNGLKVRLLVRVLILGVAVTAITWFLKTEFQDSSSFQRMYELFTSDFGDNERSYLYKEAVDFWAQSPLLGIGFRQFSVLSSLGVYSHTTYGELLSCGGIIGCIIWLVPLSNHLFKNIRLAFKTKSNNGYRYKMNMVMFMIELFVGAGQIWFYDFEHLLILVFIFGFASIDRLQSKQRDARKR